MVFRALGAFLRVQGFTLSDIKASKVLGNQHRAARMSSKEIPRGLNPKPYTLNPRNPKPRLVLICRRHGNQDFRRSLLESGLWQPRKEKA